MGVPRLLVRRLSYEMGVGCNFGKGDLGLKFKGGAVCIEILIREEEGRYLKQ